MCVSQLSVLIVLKLCISSFFALCFSVFVYFLLCTLSTILILIIVSMILSLLLLLLL